MKPIRRKQDCFVTTDPETGRDRLLGWSREEDVLSDEGSIDSTGMKRVYFLDCGCEAEPGGQCYECGAISCKACHGRCQVCRKPICMEHSRFVPGEGEEPVRLCGVCADAVSRKQLRAKIGRFLLSAFVRRKGGDGA